MTSYLFILCIILLLAALVVVVYYRNKVVSQKNHLNKILDEFNQMQSQNQELKEYQDQLLVRGRKYYNFVSEGFQFIAQHTDDQETLEKMQQDIKRDEELFVPEDK